MKWHESVFSLSVFSSSATARLHCPAHPSALRQSKKFVATDRVAVAVETYACCPPIPRQLSFILPRVVTFLHEPHAANQRSSGTYPPLADLQGRQQRSWHEACGVFTPFAEGLI